MGVNEKPLTGGSGGRADERSRARVRPIGSRQAVRADDEDAPAARYLPVRD